MSALADGIDFLVTQFNGEGAKPQLGRSGLRSATAACYGLFVFGWLVVWVKQSNRDFSAVLTLSAGIQCLGFAILTLKATASQTVAGMSSKSLEMFVLFFLARLTSTMFANGYIPVDRSGDFVYQMFDIVSLLLVLFLLYCVHKKFRHTYQDEHDSFAIHTLIAPCAVLALFLHANVNRDLFFDRAWSFSLYVETFVLVPQLYMAAKRGGSVDACTAHFVACIVLSRLLSLLFWWYGHAEIAAFEDGSHLPGRTILVSYFLQLVISADFVYYYVKSMMSGKAMMLPERGTEL